MLQSAIFLSYLLLSLALLGALVRLVRGPTLPDLPPAMAGITLIEPPIPAPRRWPSPCAFGRRPKTGKPPR